jgi:MarR family transcriptional regulator, organic hydroperoxide resistance regulator
MIKQIFLKGEVRFMEKKLSLKDESIVESYRLFQLLRYTADAIHRAREYELKKYNLTPEQAGALVCILSLGNNATQAELSRWLFRLPNSITILINRMEKMGLVKKRPDKKRKNIIRLSLTKKGYEAYLHSIEFKAFHPMITVLTAEKRQQLKTILEEVREKAFENLKLDVKTYSGVFEKSLSFSAEDTTKETGTKPGRKSKS